MPHLIQFDNIKADHQQTKDQHHTNLFSPFNTAQYQIYQCQCQHYKTAVNRRKSSCVGDTVIFSMKQFCKKLTKYKIRCILRLITIIYIRKLTGHQILHSTDQDRCRHGNRQKTADGKTSQYGKLLFLIFLFIFTDQPHQEIKTGKNSHHISGIVITDK